MPGPVHAEPEVSIVVPMLDAASRVGPLHSRIVGLLDSSFPAAELILVDDGSTDATWTTILSLAAEDGRVRGLRLAENVGQTGALCAGFSVARGEVVVMMDDDLESDACEIVNFVIAVRAGADFASGRRVGLRDPVRASGSWLYNRRLRRWGLPFHDAGCGFNAMTLELARQIAEEGWNVRQHRFKPTVARLADRIVEVRFPVRRTGSSHHTMGSLAASWLDVELAIGGLSRGSYLARSVVTPLLVSAGAVLAAARRRECAPVLVPLAAVGVGAASAASRLLSLRDAQDRKALGRPPFRIVEQVGSGCS